MIIFNMDIYVLSENYDGSNKNIFLFILLLLVCVIIVNADYLHMCSAL